MPEPHPSCFVASLAVTGYALCSAALLLSNQYAINKVAAPSFLLLSQFTGTALASKLFANDNGKQERNDAAEERTEAEALIKQVKEILPITLIFSVTMLSNLRMMLESADIETLMVFRFSSPLVLRTVDHLLLREKPPSPRCWSCLLALLIGAFGYIYIEESPFDVNGYTLCAFWYCITSMDQTYWTHVTNAVNLPDPWRRHFYSLFYSNALATMPLLFHFFHDPDEMAALKTMSAGAAFAVSVCVALAVGMSSFARMAQSRLSGERFTVLGNTCKILTILVNVSLWENNAIILGRGSLIVGLVAACFYRQAASKDAPGQPLLPQ